MPTGRLTEGSSCCACLDMGIRRRDVEQLLEDTGKDLTAFSKAFDAIQDRLRERTKEGTVEDFADWPGTKATLNVLVMCRTRCEGLIEDLRKALSEMPHELELVKEDGDEC